MYQSRLDGKPVLSHGQFGENLLETMRSNPPGPGTASLVEAKKGTFALTGGQFY